MGLKLFNLVKHSMEVKTGTLNISRTQKQKGDKWKEMTIDGKVQKEFRNIKENCMNKDSQCNKIKMWGFRQTNGSNKEVRADGFSQWSHNNQSRTTHVLGFSLFNGLLYLPEELHCNCLFLCTYGINCHSCPLKTRSWGYSLPWLTKSRR